MVDDQHGSPTWTRDLADALVRLAESGQYGTFHVTNSGHCTWWEFAEEAARVIGKPARLKPITLDNVPLRAPRPKYSALSNETLAGFGIRLPAWRDALRRSLAEGPG